MRSYSIKGEYDMATPWILQIQGENEGPLVQEMHKHVPIVHIWI